MRLLVILLWVTSTAGFVGVGVRPVSPSSSTIFRRPPTHGFRKAHAVGRPTARAGMRMVASLPDHDRRGGGGVVQGMKRRLVYALAFLAGTGVSAGGRSASLAEVRRGSSGSGELVGGDQQPELSVQRTKISSRLISHAVRVFVTRRTVGTENLSVETLSTSNREALMGKIQAVRIRCDELELATLKSSGGGVLTLVGVDFQYLRLFTNQVKPFRRPFQAFGDWVFTSQDIMESLLLRRLSKSLVNTILTRLLIIQKGKSEAQVDLVSVQVRSGSGGGDSLKPFSYADDREPLTGPHRETGRQDRRVRTGPPILNHPGA
mmetsp:Transcript_64042/g.176935  ORF Transcript_64042/g.176935 Transcript_64042/m.176935 type:complete len:319 (-) Transcript_64042:719-1675(-)